MKVYRAVVDSVIDLTKTGKFDVNIPGVGKVTVNYVSPASNIDAGFFSPPTPTSEILVLQLDADGPGKSAGYYYMGALTTKRYATDIVPTDDLSKDCLTNPQSAEEIKFPGNNIKLQSLGYLADHGPAMAREFWDAYNNQMTPEKIGWVDGRGAGITMRAQKVGGTGGWMDSRTRLQSGAGKTVDLIDTPAIDAIKITTGKAAADGGIDCITFAGKQNGIGAETNTTQAGEFRVDSHGPTNIISRNRGVGLRVLRGGKNLDVINKANGFMSSLPKGRRLVGVGGGNVYGQNPAPPGFPLYPKASTFATGQPHPDASPPGSGGDPLDKGNEDWGCVNIRSEWNNINIEGGGPDSVIHIDAPSPLCKIVVTTGGTVDIVATGKISLTSGQKIELNAPHVDINSGVRVDID